MVEDLFFHERLLLALLWRCVILYGVGRRRQAVADQAHGNPAQQATRRSQAPKPFPAPRQRRAVAPVSARPRSMWPQPRLARHGWWSPRVDAGVRWPPTSSAPSQRAAIMAGWGAAIAAPTVIPGVVPGGNGPAWRVGAIF
jgi:hypothetical protein